MTHRFAFKQVDVFTDRPGYGNPVAVVHDADLLDAADMARFANWTNLSETTFLLQPTVPEADYRLRIFTPQDELPFAGHPTLGSAHAWLEAGGRAKGRYLVQQCGAGLIRLRQSEGGLAFAAPPLLRQGPVETALIARILPALGLVASDLMAAHWVDNGPGWLALMLRSRAQLLAIQPDFAAIKGLRVGVCAPWDRSDDGDEADFELRAFSAAGNEDPVTGSLNAGVAQWLIGAGMAPSRYVASQGTALGRAGRIEVVEEGGEIWVGGGSVSCISGHVQL